MIEILQRWWSKKYSIPWNHDLFQERTYFDLLVEFELDYFEQNPIEVHRNEDGEIQFVNTGDKLIDKWEAQVARGEQPDYSDMLTDEVRAKLDRLRERGDRRTRGIGGSFKQVHDQIASDAQRQGLDVPSTTFTARRHRSNFGDGTD